MNLGNWIRHFLIYGSGVVLMNALPILLIPIYTHGVVPSDYGVVELLNRSQELLLVILSLGLRSTLLTLYQMEEGDQQKTLYSTALQFLIASTFILVGLAAIAAKPIGLALFGRDGYSIYVVVMLASTYFETLFQIAALYLQSELKSTAYILVFAGRAVFSVLINLLLVSIFHLGLWGIALATLIHTVLATVFLVAYVLYRTGLTFDLGLLPGMLKFGIPLVPAAILMFILNNGDRYFLNAVASRDEVGIYGLGYRFAQVASSVVLLPFGKIWSVVMVNIARAEDGAARLGRISSYLITALLFVTLGASLFAPYVISTLATSRYYEAYRVVAPVALAYVFYSWTTVTDASFYLTKRTTYKPVILALSGVVVLALYALWIPRYGMIGAAWATLGGYAAFAVISYLFAQRVYAIRYEWPRVFVVLAASILLYASVAWIAPLSLFGIAVRLLSIGVFMLLVSSDLVSTSEEREQVKTYALKAWARIFKQTAAAATAV